MTPQENQPGEAARYIFASQKEIANAQVGSIRPEYVLAEDYAAERAKRLELEQWKKEQLTVTADFQAIGKLMGLRLGESVWDKILPWMKQRLELEGELATAKRANQFQFDKLQGVQAHLRKSEAELAEFVRTEPLKRAELTKLRAELLALRGGKLELENQVAFMLGLRGGKVGQSDLGGSEITADGESRPTSARCPDCGGLGYVIGAPIDYQHTGHAYSKPVTCGKCWGTGMLRDSGDSEAEKGQAPSPEPAAIPKTTGVREFWIVDTREPGTTNSIICTDCGLSDSPEEADRRAEDGAHPHYGLIHVREVTGEGRKVSAELEALTNEIIIDFTKNNSYCDNCKKFVNVRYNQHDLVCQECDWVMLTIYPKP